MSSSSASSSSSSASATSTSKADVEPSKSNQTIGLAVGLGVGIPILLTIIILGWVTMRHRRKMREEDEVDKDIDFNGDVSFWSPQQSDAVKFGAYPAGLDVSSGSGSTNLRRDTITTSHTNLCAGDSTANISEVDAISQSDGNPAISHMYTPELGFTQGSQENFSRAIANVYGPSPAYPSTERLRAPSIAGSLGSLRNGHGHSGSFSSHGGGPFATPPRRGSTPIYSGNGHVVPPSASFSTSTHPYANHYRRTSNGSSYVDPSPMEPPSHMQHHQNSDRESTVYDGEINGASRTDLSSIDDGVPIPPVHNSNLTGLRESPHPYSNLAGTQSMRSFHTSSSRVNVNDNGADDQDETTSDPPSDPASPLRGAKQIYHEQARDRGSKHMP